MEDLGINLLKALFGGDDKEWEVLLQTSYDWKEILKYEIIGELDINTLYELILKRAEDDLFIELEKLYNNTEDIEERKVIIGLLGEKVTKELLETKEKVDFDFNDNYYARFIVVIDSVNSIITMSVTEEERKLIEKYLTSKIEEINNILFDSKISTTLPVDKSGKTAVIRPLYCISRDAVNKWVKLNNLEFEKNNNILILGQKYEDKYFIFVLKVSKGIEFEYYWKLFMENGFSNKDFRKINLEKFKKEVDKTIKYIHKWNFTKDLIEDEFFQYFIKKLKKK